MNKKAANGFSAGPRALDWNDLEIILAICRAESLSGAARLLAVNHSTVSRRINTIEDKTGVRFFDRLPNGYFMTQMGEAVMEHAENIEREVHDLGRKVLGKDLELSGRIRLTCSEGLAVEFAPTAIAKFCKLHPKVAVHIEPRYDRLDLSRHEAEVAIRFSKNPPESAFGRKVCDFGAALYSSHDYVEQMRDVPLAQHNWCFAGKTTPWLVPLIWPSVEAAQQRTVMSSESPQGVINAVAAGLGNMVMACHLADPDPRLVRISENLAHLNMGVWVLTHPDLRRTARIRTLMTHLAEETAAHRASFIGDLRVGGTDILLSEKI